MTFHDKSSLGQNFIKYPGLVRELVVAADITDQDLVLEIGSGKGIITQEIAKKAKEVWAIEKDKTLFDQLNDKFSPKGTSVGALISNVKLINIDFLEFNLPEEKYKVLSNIPFSITSEIINKFLKTKNRPEEMYLILQKEAAEKFAGIPKETQSSILTKPFYEVEILGEIDRTNFTLKPQIKIVFAKFTKREKPFILEEDIPEFRRFVIYGFNYFMKAFSFAQRKNLEKMYKLAGKKPTEVSFDTWLILYKTFKKIGTEKSREVLTATKYQ